MGPTSSVRDHATLSADARDRSRTLSSTRRHKSADLGVKGSRVQIPPARRIRFTPSVEGLTVRGGRPPQSSSRRAARRCVLVAHRRGGGEASIDDTEDASDERAEAPALDGGVAATPSPEAGGGAPDAASALIDQARPCGVRRLRAQLRVAMSRPRGTSRRVCSIFIRFRSPELAGLPNSLSVKVTTQGTHTTLWR